MGNEEKKTEDAFEASEMHDGARIVHRDKKVSRGMAALLAAPGLLTIALGIFIGFVNSSSEKPLPSAALPIVIGALVAMGLGFLLLGVMFGVLRTVVTEQAVHVKYGLWGPTIPLSSILACRIVEYDWTQYGGWGLRRGKKGWAYVPTNGPCVEIEYREDGEDRHVLIGGENASATVHEINRQLAMSQAHRRVSGSAARVVDEEFEEREEEAQEADERARKQAR